MSLETDLANLASRVTRLEALNGIDPPATPTTPAAPDVIVEAYRAVHVQSGILNAAKVIRWKVNGTTRGGYNAAHASAGERFTIENINTGTKTVYGVNVPTFTRIPSGADLANHIRKGAKLKLEPGRYTLSRPMSLEDVTIVGAGFGVTIVEWTGDDLYPNSTTPVALFTTKRSAVWSLTFDSTRRYDKTQPKLEKERRPLLFQVGDDSTFVGIHAIDFSFVFMGNWKPSRVFIADCRADGVRKYFAWYEGADWILYDNTCTNSIFEHICRGGPSSRDSVYGWTRVAFDGNSFSNADNRPGDPNDDAKGTIVMQAGEYGYVRDNTLKGPTGIGPLAVGDNGYANQLTRYVVHEANQLTKPVELWPGLSDALIIDEQFERKAPRGADPRVIDRVRVMRGGQLVETIAATPIA